VRRAAAGAARRTTTPRLAARLRILGWDITPGLVFPEVGSPWRQNSMRHEEQIPPSVGQRYADLIESLTELAQTLTRNDSVRDTLQSILGLALRTVPHCHAASVTVLDDKNQPGTVVGTDDDTYELDRRQYELTDGPCLDAARRQVVNRWSLSEAEQRFPDFTEVAKDMGLRSYLSAGLALAGRRLGALNLSSRDDDGFSELDEEMVALFTVPAAAAIVVADRYADARDLASQLEHALQSRAVIDQAIGVVMAESRCSPDEAFAKLSRASNNRNVKLRDLATEIVEQVSGSPDRGNGDHAG
jgi:transcriptional regulator with GAF, ATPase, and Fis domain